MIIGGANFNQRYWLLLEALKWCFGMSVCTIPAIVLGLVEHLPKALNPERHNNLLIKADNLKKRLHDTLTGPTTSSPGVLLFPVHPTTAPIHDLPLLRPLNIAYTGLFNIMELPCTAVPMGLDVNGLPVGIQIIGARGADELTIAAACALERKGVAGWIPP